MKGKKVRPKDIVHGTYNAYQNHGCRCDKCRRANSDVQRENRARRIARLEADPTLATHGSRSTYINWGCRCPECSRAHADACRENDIKAGRRSGNPRTLSKTASQLTISLLETVNTKEQT